MRKILFLFLAVFAASILAKQAPVAQAAKTQQTDANLSSSNLTAKDKTAQKLNLTQDPAIVSGELANGLKYYVKENKQPANSAYFYLVVNIGSTDERENELGLAHFTEHMAFNGSREFSKNELVKKLESLGVAFGADLNAQTSYDQTSYLLEIHVNEQNLKDVFRVFRDWIDGMSFDAAELDKERGIIIEEERARNTPAYRFYIKNRVPELYGDSIYAKRSPIGDMNIVKNVDVVTIKGFYERTYQPRFMKFIAVGDFNKNRIEELIKQSFSSAKNTNDYASPDKTIPIKSGFSVNNYDSAEIGLNSLNLIFTQKYKFDGEIQRLRQNLLVNYISDLVAMIYEQRNLALRGRFYSPIIEDQNVLYAFEINAVEDDFSGALSDLAGVLKGVQKFGFSEADFESVKKDFINSAKNAYLQAGNKRSSAVAANIEETTRTGGVLLGEKDLRDVTLALLESIGLEDVNAEFRRILGIDAKTLNVISAKGAKLNEAKFDQIWAEAKPYDTLAANQAKSELFDYGALKPKNFVSKKHNEKLDFYLYELPNGARVAFKEVKTKKDVVWLSAVSRGGASNLPKPKQGALAVEVSNESGAGEFSNYDLAKILSGKQLSYSKFIDQLSQGYSASSASADFEWLLRALFLEFSEPRFDENALKKTKINELEKLEKTKNLPERKFRDEFARFFYENNPRTNPLEAADINELQMEDVKKIVKEKFTNAASYDFIVVGDLNLTAAEPLLQKYLANLPARTERENFVDDGVRTISGEREFKRSYQTTQRSDAAMIMKNEKVKYSRPELLRVNALSAVLSMMLREDVREDRGQVYGLGVHMNLAKYPYESFTAHFGFTAAPDNVNAVLGEIKSNVAELKGGADVKRYLQNFKKSALVKMRQSYVQGEFWTRALMRELVFGDEVLSLDEYEKAVNALTEQDVRNAAKLYLDEKNVVISVNDPASAK